MDETRLTSLDRRISRPAFTQGDGTVDLDSLAEPRSAADRARRTFMVGRLRKLAVMGLAEEVSTNRWHIDPTFLACLCDMQNANDRQKIYAAHTGPNYDRRGR